MDDDAPGWSAISAEFDRLYPGQTPRHWAAAAKLPGDPGIDGLSAYWTGATWHFVTLGVTELWLKESDDPEVSGFGFEFTMKTPPDVDGEPPAWAIRLLQKCSEAMFNGAGFAAGHTLDPRGAITGAEDTELRAILFVHDPELRSIETPHGRVEFVEVVGITLEDLARVKQDHAGTIAQLRAINPKFVTDPRRTA